MNKQSSWVIVLAIGFLGCKEDEKPKPAEPAPKVEKAKRPEFKPEYTITIEPTAANPPRYMVKWTAKVNTGGWKLTTDQARAEEKHRELRLAEIYATLEEPGESEVVTEALETLKGEFDGGTEKVDGAQLHVRRKVRGQNTEWKPLYGIVATVGKQW